VKRRQILELAGLGLLAWSGDARGQAAQVAPPGFGRPFPARPMPARPVPLPSAKPTASATPPPPEPAKPSAPRLALVGAELHRAGEPPLANSVIVLEGDRIASIGIDPKAADGLTAISLHGKRVTAALVDPLTRVGITEIDLEEGWRDDALHGGSAIAASFAAADGYDPRSPLVAITRREGLGSVGVVPTGGVVMGQSAWVDLDGEAPRDSLATRSMALHVHLDDYALGSGPTNRASALRLVRELLDDAREYAAKREAFDRRQWRELGASRADLDVVARSLEGKLPVVFHVDRASDIHHVLAVVAEYKLRGVVASAAEGWRVGRELAAARVPAIVYPLDEGPRDFAARGAREENAAMLAAAGVTIALSTGESHNARKLRQVAGNAVRAGLPHATALAAITDAPARIFGLEDYGAPKERRVANLAVWSGDPLELSTRCERLFVRGREVSLRSRQTALFEKYR
jgi:imidazolonepropionase-like amidohydrolase